MMSGKLYVDGYDVYKQFGVYVTGDGLNSLIAFPPLKSVDSNDWHEEDGTEVDLSDPVLNTRDVSITFAISGAFARYGKFVDLLSDGAYHVFQVYGRSYTLRLVSQGSRETMFHFGRETLKFADDFPFDGYTYNPPISALPVVDDYSIDDLPLTAYGARVLKGSFAEVLKTSAVKPNMLRNIKTKAGVIYDSENVTYKAKDVKLSILMRAETLTELWRNYDALLYDLIRPEERLLTVKDIEQEFPFYYKNCTVSEFYPEDRIWLKFSLTLTFTRDFRIDENGVVLSAEDGSLVVDENGVYLIDLLPNRFTMKSVRFVNDRQTLRLTANGKFRFNN